MLLLLKYGSTPFSNRVAIVSKVRDLQKRRGREMNIRSSLNAEMAINGKKQTPNDEIDIDRAAIGLRISDYFFADNEKKLAIERCQLDEKYQTKVYSAKKDSVSSLITELSEL